MKKILVLSIAAIAVTLASCNGSAGGNPNRDIVAGTTYTLVVSRNNDGGDVVVNQGSTNPGQTLRKAGATITITAWAKPGYKFVNWIATAGDLPEFINGNAEAALIQFKMNSHVLIRAIFQEDSSGGGGGSTYMLNVSRNPVAGGDVAINSSLNPAPSSYTAGTAITVTAIPASGYAFQNWTAVTGTLPAFTQGSAATAAVAFSITGMVNIQANFQEDSGGGPGTGPIQPTTYTLDVSRNIDAGGSVSVNGSINPLASSLIAGTQVTITATPASDYSFVNWTATSGSLPAFTQGSSATATVTFSINSAVSIRANFQSNAPPPPPPPPPPEGSGWDDYPTGGQGTVHPYPFPSGMPKYTNISVTAGGHSIDLYSVRANNTHQWDINAQQLCDQLPVAMFDISGGAVTVEVTVNSATNVQIRPKSLNITPTISGNKISFSLPKPGQYSVEWNNQANNPKNAVLIFANPYEDFTAIAASPKTKVYDTGVHMLPGQGLFVGEGQTILLKPGAVLRGRVRFYKDPETWPHDGPADNSKIVGRGIIDGSHLQDSISAETILPIQTVGVDNVEINGISIFDPNGWTIELKFSSNIKIYNMKMITSRCNSDGVTIQTTNGVTIENSFLRTWDDGVVVKNYEMPAPYTNTFSQDIYVKNCIFWTDLAQSMEIGFETNKFGLPNPTIKNVNFENITVFHALHKPPISIHNGDNAAISNVTFKNIVIENFQCGEGDGWQYLIDFTNVKGGEVPGTASSWTTVSTRGSISDVTVENVNILAGKTPGARFMNSASGGSINNITVRNITYQGAPLNLSSGIRPGGTVNVNFQ